MDSDKEKNITRRKFAKNVAGTALCCACLPLRVLADSARTSENNNEERKKVKMTVTDKEHLAAACGTYCGACPAYMAKHGEDEQIKMKLQKSFSSEPMKARKRVTRKNTAMAYMVDGLTSQFTKSVRPTGRRFFPERITSAKSIFTMMGYIMKNRQTAMGIETTGASPT